MNLLGSLFQRVRPLYINKLQNFLSADMPLLLVLKKSCFHKVNRAKWARLCTESKYEFNPPKTFNVKNPPHTQSMKEFFTHSPSKAIYNFFNTSQAGLQRILTPLTSRPIPTAGLIMTNP